MKAYLAHSSNDKNYVRRVANRMGRAIAIYDDWTFYPGGNLIAQIREGIVGADAFVLFASRASLQSTWVALEVNEAEWADVHARLESVFTVIIDSTIDIGDLPEWMRQTTILSAVNPRQATREILWRMAETQHGTHQKPFVGRERDLEALASQLITDPDVEPPRIVVVHGLEGVGRRTFVRRALADYMALQHGPVIELLETDTLSELHIKLLDEVVGFDSRNALAEEIRLFASLSLDDRGLEISRLLANMARDNQIPLLLDRGMLLDDYGRYTEEALAVFTGLANHKDGYAILLQRRKPDLVGQDLSVSIAVHALQPLSVDATEDLLRQSLRGASVVASGPQVKELSQYIGGYPPAAELATSVAKTYGIEVLIADQGLLNSFLGRMFAGPLKKLSLAEAEIQVLRLLAGEMVLSVDALAAITATSTSDLASSIRRLIDLNLVTLTADGYEIARPVVRSVENLYGALASEEFNAIAKYLKEAYWSDDVLPSIRIVDATIHALARSGSPDLDEFRDLILPSVLLRVAIESYHRRDFGRAIEFAQRVLDFDGSSHRARRVLCQAQVREANWGEAERILEEITAAGRREQFYLRGFMNWKRGRLDQAIVAFRSALDARDQAVNVYRDLAHCLFRMGELKEAWQMVESADRRYPGNRFVVDLAAQIAIARKDFKNAETYVAQLEQVDEESNAHHRRATLLAEQGQLAPALKEADAACEPKRPRFEALAQRADILVRLGRNRDAETAVNALRPGPDLSHRDVKTGLECKRLLRLGKHREASVVWEQLIGKDRPVHKALRSEILRQLRGDISVSLAERDQATRALDALGDVLDLPLAVAEEELE